MRTQADRDEDLALGRELERKDAEIERLKETITKAFGNLDVALSAPADVTAENDRLRAALVVIASYEGVPCAKGVRSTVKTLVGIAKGALTAAERGK